MSGKTRPFADHVRRKSPPEEPTGGTKGKLSVTILDKPAARDLYDRIAVRYDGWLSTFRLLGLDRWRRRLIDALDIAPGDEVVDLGCGTGENLVLLAAAVGPGGRVVGIDLNEGMLDRARTKVASARLDNVELICGDVESFEVPRTASAVLRPSAWKWSRDTTM